jgi:hypothetical protein
VDFREIRDDGEGSWNRLCLALNGRGVENLDDELKQMRYTVLNEAFKAVISLGALNAPGLGEQQFAQAFQYDNSFPVAARDFLIEMSRLSNVKPSVSQMDKQINTIELRIKRLAALLKMKPISKDAQTFHARLSLFLASADNVSLLMAWVLMRGVKSTALETFGLDCTLRRMLDKHGAQHGILLLSALLAYPETSAAMATAFSASVCREFLQVHESEGVEWFNKERFETLAEWLSILGFLLPDKLSMAVGKLSAAAAHADQGLHDSIALAAHAGYRTGLFLHLSSALDKSTVVEKTPDKKKKELKVKPLRRVL